jgi:hypothetical protein
MGVGLVVVENFESAAVAGDEWREAVSDDGVAGGEMGGMSGPVRVPGYGSHLPSHLALHQRIVDGTGNADDNVAADQHSDSMMQSPWRRSHSHYPQE